MVSDQGSGLSGFFRAIDRPEYVRTCKKCGYTWEVNGYYAKLRSNGVGIEYGAATGRPVGYNPDARDALGEDVARLRTCDQCGAHDDYVQKRIWHESKVDFDGSDE